ncbi:hypothetical protein IWQ62_003240 [Dispira parvispora]|uniref:BZIP domain-containing protein n=1 Tax=Dispira parvispora TaxID=1520584 RepID=A0A9W8AP15_9FUNG|nr:hypothetical protein IWQ62_003240 [Dispira parvispora]
MSFPSTGKGLFRPQPGAITSLGSEAGASTPSRYILEAGDYSFTPDLGEFSEMNPFETSFHKSSAQNLAKPGLSTGMTYPPDKLPALVTPSASALPADLALSQPGPNAATSASPSYTLGQSMPITSTLLPLDNTQPLNLATEQRAIAGILPDTQSTVLPTHEPPRPMGVATTVNAAAVLGMNVPESMAAPVLQTATVVTENATQLQPDPATPNTGSSRKGAKPGRKRENDKNGSVDSSTGLPNKKAARRGADRQSGRKPVGGNDSITSSSTTSPVSIHSSIQSNTAPRPSQSSISSVHSTDATGESFEQSGDAEEKRQRFLERNRIAASKCRQKKKQWIENLKQQSEEVTQRNKHLSYLVRQLKDEVQILKAQLLAHRNCDSSDIQQYLKNNGQLNSMASLPVGNNSVLMNPTRAISQSLTDNANGGPIIHPNLVDTTSSHIPVTRQAFM